MIGLKVTREGVVLDHGVLSQALKFDGYGSIAPAATVPLRGKRLFGISERVSISVMICIYTAYGLSDQL